MRLLNIRGGAGLEDHAILAPGDAALGLQKSPTMVLSSSIGG